MDDLIEEIASTLAEAYSDTTTPTPTEQDRQAARSLIPILEDLALRAVLQDRLSTVESAIQVNLEDL
jgi:hypothetical protein